MTVSRYSSSLAWYIALLVVLAVALVLRLHSIDAPLADWHSWRQADTASVTREYLKHNHSILEPRYHDLSNIPSGLENPNGYRMVEFPVAPFATAGLLRAFPSMDLVRTSRLISIAASLVTIFAVHQIVWLSSRKRWQALIAAGALAVLPYSIFYSRTILPEPLMLAAQTVAVWMFVHWSQASETKSRVFFLTLTWLSFSLALLLKPIAIFIAPVFAVLLWQKYGFQALFAKESWLLVTAAIPLLLWRHWIEQFPAGIPANSWLFNGNGIRLRPAWWRWLFADRLGRLILGYWGTTLVVLGLVYREAKKLSSYDLLTLAWASGQLAYLVVFATGNVQHDYYQIPLVPMLTLLIARGYQAILSLSADKIHRVGIVAVLAVLSSMSLFFSWYEVRGYFNINNPAIVKAGRAVDDLTPIDAKVIAPYGGDTAFLFQTNRTGWPIGSSIEDKIEKGATTYATTTYDDEARELEKLYTTLEKTPEHLILDLTSSL